MRRGSIFVFFVFSGAGCVGGVVGVTRNSYLPAGNVCKSYYVRGRVTREDVREQSLLYVYSIRFFAFLEKLIFLAPSSPAGYATKETETIRVEETKCTRI